MKKVFAISLLAVLLAGCSNVQYTEKVSYHPAKGSELAKVRIVEWGDFQCPACSVAYKSLKPTFDKYEGMIYRQYRHYPLTSIHPLAYNAAVASECATEQDKFWEYHDLLYDSQPNLKKADLLAYANRLGLNSDDFKTCYDSRVKTKQVKDDMAAAEKLGIQSTPTFYLNDQLVTDWQKLPQLIELELSLASTTPQ